jgi:hypothetical protein
VKDLPVGVSVEIKARADFNPLAWLLQAKKNARPGDRPLVVIRCNKQGERAGEYLVIRCLDDDVLALGPQAMVMLRDLDVELNHPEFGLRYAPQVVGTEHSNQPEDNGGTSD